MYLVNQTILLFSLNLLDAILTLFWVRNGVATEGNLLMAKLLEIGDLTFLGTKIAVGAFAAIVLLTWGNRKVARYGVSIALALYIGLMGIHFFTGLSAAGLVSGDEIGKVLNDAAAIFASLI